MTSISVNDAKMDVLVIRTVERLCHLAHSRRIREEIERVTRTEIPAAVVYSSLQRLEKAGTLTSEKPVPFRFYKVSEAA